MSESVSDAKMHLRAFDVTNGRITQWRRTANRRRRRRWLAIWFACCLLGVVAPRALGQQASDAVVNREYPLKALFLYNFGSYIEWPSEDFADAQSPFVIGILGSDVIDDTLKEIAGSKKDCRTKTRRGGVCVGRPGQTMPNSVYRSRSPTGAATGGDRQAGDKHVLVVGESDGFAEHGGVVNFYVEANKIHFEINVDVAKQRHLKVSSKLLAHGTNNQRRVRPHRPL